MDAMLAAVAAVAPDPPSPPQRLTEKQRWECVIFREQGWAIARIASKLDVRRATVRAVIARHKATGSPGSGSRKGRPRKTDEALDTAIAAHAITEPFTSPRRIVRKLELEVSPRTVDRRLQEAGLFGCVAEQVRHFSDAEKRKRLSFAEGYSRMDWNTVIFSDEKIFWGDGFCGQTWVRRPVGEALNPAYTVHKTAHPVKVNVWACFAATGQGFIHIFDDTLDGPMMVRILDKNLLPSRERLLLPGQWYFLHDNDKKFHSRVAQKWIHDNGVSCIEFPPYSPDLNPIENLWAALAREVEKTPCSDVLELQDAVEKAWENASKDLMANLVASMPRRCAAVVEARGWHTKY